MKSAVENLSPTRVKLTVEVPSADLKPRMDAAYKTIGEQVTVPGFRKGKVPSRIIDQRFGRGAVVQEAVNDALPEYYSQAMQENELTPLGQPEVSFTELPLGDGQDLKFEAEVDIVPAFDLPDFSTISVEVDPVTVDEADVESRMDNLRARFGTLVSVDRAAAAGDFTSVDLSASIDGEEIDSVTGVSYEIGSGTMLEGLDEALVGASAGDTVEFTSPLAGGDRAGQVADVVVTLQSVKERELPVLDDEFAQLASEFDTLEELQADLRRQAEQGAKFEQGVQARDKVLEQMLELTEIPLPDNLVEQEVHEHLEKENRLEDDEHRSEVEASTRKAMKTQFLLDALVAQNNVQVDQGELIEYIMMTAQQYGMNPNEFAQQIDSQGQVPAMVTEVGRRKALATVLEQATVTDSDGNTVDLSELDPGSGDEADDKAEDGQTDSDEAAESAADVSVEDSAAADSDEQDAAEDEATAKDA
ncbi:trigger factor [Ornithinimicrobium sediminis]|uniref:trigger factor n=1 Tax=Ornithinimicrobium sediminis TaxID=2904603 RepID=UPI001E49DE45|nr:trigger factor [Ornithinimicrobium sediminis]